MSEHQDAERQRVSRCCTTHVDVSAGELVVNVRPHLDEEPLRAVPIQAFL